MTDIEKEEWISRCCRQYINRGCTNEQKARLWAESTFHRLDNFLTTTPEDAADADLNTWDPI
jgi:hypothetical protein